MKVHSISPLTTLAGHLLGGSFYLTINHTGWTSVRWFKCNPMCEDRLSRCMKIIAQKVGLVGKYTNHSVRRTMCTQLLRAGVAPTLITQLSGHKNINSLSSYATASHNQQHAMCSILQGSNKTSSPHLSLPEPQPVPLLLPALPAAPSNPLASPVQVHVVA